MAEKKEIDKDLALPELTPETSLPAVVKDMWLNPDLPKIGLSKKGLVIEELKLFLSTVPAVDFFVKQIGYRKDYQLGRFFRNYMAYLYRVQDLPLKERGKFYEELERRSQDSSEYILTNLVDRLDNVNKGFILANLSRARINGEISIEDFFRLSSMLDRIPYVDILELLKYLEPFYDENGDTDLLYSTGALVLREINNTSGMKYSLSMLGKKFLKFGCGIDIPLDPVDQSGILAIEAIGKVEIERQLAEALDFGEY